MIRSIRNWLFPSRVRVNLHVVANCPECMKFVRSQAAVRLSQHLACRQTGHGMDNLTSNATLAAVVLLIDKQSEPLRKLR